MKFGVREICNVVFKAKSDRYIGNKLFRAGQPVLYIDTAKTSTTEGAATTVYATGGRGNSRLVAWEGEKTLTFTVEDALLSPIGFAVLSGAGLFNTYNQGATTQDTVHVHMTTETSTNTGEIDLTDALSTSEKIDPTAPVFVLLTESDGSLSGTMLSGLTVSEDGKKLTGDIPAGQTVFVDYYVSKTGSTNSNVSEIQIDAENFAGYYYVEANTLFRRQSDGVDMPAEITFPNVKIQSNFTFTMASSGDPSTFTFTMDAFPGYTYFNRNKKVLCVIQIIDEDASGSTIGKSVMLHPAGIDIPETSHDSTEVSGEPGTDPTPDPTSYTVTVSDAITNGTVVADKSTATEGETITLTVAAETGYELTALAYNDEPITVVASQSTYTFTMPSANVVVTATFTQN